DRQEQNLPQPELVHLLIQLLPQCLLSNVPNGPSQNRRASSLLDQSRLKLKLARHPDAAVVVVPATAEFGSFMHLRVREFSTLQPVGARWHNSKFIACRKWGRYVDEVFNLLVCAI